MQTQTVLIVGSGPAGLFAALDAHLATYLVAGSSQAG